MSLSSETTALGDAAKVCVVWHPVDALCTTTARDLDDPMPSDVWGDRLTRLETDVTAPRPTGALELTGEELR
jgi:hypothetical protein